MNAKEYLNQIMLLDVKINQRIEEKESLPNGYTDLQKRISEVIDQLVNQKDDIIGKILLLHNPLQSEVIFLRYVRYYKYQSIAEILQYSMRGIYKIHDAALLELAAIIGICE